MISSLIGVNINIENATHKSPINTKPIFLFPHNPLTTKNIPKNKIKKYQKPDPHPLIE